MPIIISLLSVLCILMQILTFLKLQMRKNGGRGEEWGGFGILLQGIMMLFVNTQQ